MSARSRLLLGLLLAAFGGVLNFVCVATFDIWPLGWVAQVPLLWLVVVERERQRAGEDVTPRPVLYGFVCGLVTNAGGFYWIVPFLQRFGHLPLVAAVPIFLLLVSYQAITFTLFAWLLDRLLRAEPDRRGGVILLAPILWVAIEVVVPFVFPWYLAISQAWVRPAIQIAELTGPLGVSALLMLVNAIVFEVLSARLRKRALPRRRVAGGLAVVAVVFGWSLLRIEQIETRRAEAPRLRVGMVQANIGIVEKWLPELGDRHLAAHQALAADLERRGAELIVWPESSYPFVFRHDQTRDWPAGDRREARKGFSLPLFFGTLTKDLRNGHLYNSAMLLDKDGQSRGVFDKNILMVFGEYLPYYEQMKWLQKLIPEISNWSRGTDVTTMPLEHAGKTWQLGPMICYEDIFPSFGRRLAKLGPNLLINITNDAWFGRTAEPYEHMALAVFRAVETRVDLVRAVNTGVTGFIDSTGRVIDETHSVDPDETPGVQPETMIADVRLQPPSTLYATLGEWFGGLCLLLLCIIGVRARAAAGMPIRWPLVGIGAGTLLVAIIVGSLVGGPQAVAPSLLLLAHRATGLDDAHNFTYGVHLFAIAALASIAVGYVVRRRADRHPDETPRPPAMETAIALFAILAVPALLVGTLEGEQAGLVLSFGLAILLARLGARLAARQAGRPGDAPTPAASSSPSSPPPRRSRNRKTG